MKNIKIGVVADDFTGASDAASFLVKAGLNPLLLTEIPYIMDGEIEYDSVVIALKTRSCDASQAIEETKKAVDYLLKIKSQKLYFKYCSTFDSTAEGNIGNVLDFILDYLNQEFTIICPSLPINGRTVKDGILYVNGIRLEDSPMKNHPLNPMNESFIPKLMKPQSKYPVFLENKVEDAFGDNLKYYIVPNYENDNDAKTIVKKYNDLFFISGGSGLLEHIFEAKPEKVFDTNSTQDKSIILCGSCSVATGRQIKSFIKSGGISYEIDANKLIDKTLDISMVLNKLETVENPIIIYSDAVFKEMDEISKSKNFLHAGVALEKFYYELTKEIIKKDYKKIIVAGGETSGSVMKSLNYSSFIVGKSVSPGVPVLQPTINKSLKLILKSGNFGSEDFFVKALEV